MEKESGEREILRRAKSQIPMKEIMTLIEKMDMENLIGIVEINIKGIIKTMRDMGMVRCFG